MEVKIKMMGFWVRQRPIQSTYCILSGSLSSCSMEKLFLLKPEKVIGREPHVSQPIVVCYGEAEAYKPCNK